MAKRAMELAESFREDEYNPLQRRPGWRQTATLLATLGDIKFRRGEYEEAVRYLKDCIRIREHGVAYYSKFSDAADFRIDLADGLQRLSIVYLESGNKVAALEAAERACKLTEVLVAEYKENKSLNVAFAGMLNSFGDGLAANGRIQEAYEKFQRASAIFENALTESPDDIFLVGWKSICMERLGNVKASEKKFAEAAQVFEETLKLKEQLVFADSSNARFKNDVVIITNKLERARNLAASAGKE
jgi:tetratricopeptide (TPR) repeat protein